MQPKCVKSFIRYPNGVRVHPDLDPARCCDGARETPGGICFTTPGPLAAGETVQVSLDTPHGSEDVVVKVAWSEAEDGVWLTGGRLVGDDDACRARLAAQLCLIDAYRRSQCACGRDMDEETAAREWITRYAHQVPALT